MNISHRHHFLPEFYLKGFTNEQGFFVVYNGQKKRIKKGWHSPKSHFFDEDRNSIELNGVPVDIPEQAYSILDNRMADIFKKIQDCRGVPKLTVHEMTGLYYFLSNLFWRSPENDARYEKAVDVVGARNLFNELNSQTRQMISGFPELALTDKDLINFMRPLAGTQYLENSKGQNFKEWGILYSPNGQFICSDRPFLALDRNDIFNSSFVVPLTKYHLLIKSSKPILTVPAKVVLAIQLALVQQAEEFCAGPDKELFKAIMNDRSYYSIEFLKDVIFGYLSEGQFDPENIFGESDSRFFTIKLKI